MSRECYLGIDIGTGSARAGLFDAAGDLLAMSTHPIRIWKPEADVTEQSSADIWQATCTAVREAVASAGVDPAQRSEERRVGRECRSRWAAGEGKKAHN